MDKAVTTRAGTRMKHVGLVVAIGVALFAGTMDSPVLAQSLYSGAKALEIINSLKTTGTYREVTGEAKNSQGQVEKRTYKYAKTITGKGTKVTDPAKHLGQLVILVTFWPDLNPVIWEDVNAATPNSVTGTWKGRYANSKREAGGWTLRLVENNNVITGSDEGNPVEFGRRNGNIITFQSVADGRRAWYTCSLSPDRRSIKAAYRVVVPPPTPDLKPTQYDGNGLVQRE